MVRSRRAHRRSTKPNTLRRARSRIKVHAHHHRRYAGIRGGSRKPRVVKPVKPRSNRVSKTGRHHPHKGYHGPRRHGALHKIRTATHHRRKGYHLKHPRKKGYHLKHPRKRGYHVHRKRGYHIKKRHGYHVHRKKGYHVHRRKGLKHPHKGWHGHRHFKHHNTWHRKKDRPAQQTAPISAASYLSMF